MGPAGSVALAQGMLQIDGRGRYLLPGLADMHVHIVDDTHGLLYLANAVTTIRNMSGRPSHLIATERVERGEWLAPMLHTTGPILDGVPPIWPSSIVVRTTDEGERAVEAQRDAGFTSIKVYDNLASDTYSAIVTTARRRFLSVVGHVPRAVGLPGALAVRQDSVEHLQGYLAELPHQGFAALAEQTRAAGAWNCPTLTVLYQRAALLGRSEKLARPEVRYLTTSGCLGI